VNVIARFYRFLLGEAPSFAVQKRCKGVFNHVAVLARAHVLLAYRYH
jgi:hypothetical protein